MLRREFLRLAAAGGVAVATTPLWSSVFRDAVAANGYEGFTLSGRE